MNLANITFDILRGIAFAFTMSFPLYVIIPSLRSTTTSTVVLMRHSCRVSDAAASVFNVMNDYLAQRAFSRKLEEEADALGIEVRNIMVAHDDSTGVPDRVFPGLDSSWQWLGMTPERRLIFGM